MANVIRFEIKTDNSYNDDETVDLLDSFLEFMNETDGNIVEDSEEVTILSEEKAKEVAISDDERNEIIQDFLDNAKIEVKVSLTNGEITFGHKMN